MASGSSYRFEVSFRGSTVSVQRDGALVLISSILTRLSAGKVGLLVKRSYAGYSYWDDVTVVKTGADQIAAYDDYYPFGQVIEGRSYNAGLADARFKYTEKERDVETGYDYFGARYYDGRIGRWHNVDPHSDLYADVSPYSYVANNPLICIDPTGEDLIKVTYCQLSAVVDRQIAAEVYEIFREVTDAGIKLNINTSFRTTEYQQNLYSRWEKGEPGIYMPAKAGTSPHEAAFALDVSLRHLSPAHQKTVKAIMKRHGFTWKGKKDYPHFDTPAQAHGYPSNKAAIVTNQQYNKDHGNDIPSYSNQESSTGGGQSQNTRVASVEIGPVRVIEVIPEDAKTTDWDHQ